MLLGLGYCRIQHPSISKGHFLESFPTKQEKNCALITKFVSLHKFELIIFNEYIDNVCEL